MTPKLLTIAIPTFNRNDVLTRNLERLLPQLAAWAHLLIVDNNSTVPVKESVRDVFSRYPDTSIEIVRNSANIGANANILRCIEHCDSEYIWIIGDDDFPSAGSLSTIHQHIAQREPIWVNFYSDDPEHQPRRTRNAVAADLGEFLNQLESISELVFVSNNIYKTKYIQQGLESGHMHQAMMAPHLISMLAGLEKMQPTGSYVISTSELFQSISNNQDATTAWPLYNAFLGILGMYRIPLTDATSASILRLVRGTRMQWLSDRYMFAAFSGLSSRQGAARAWRISSGFTPSLMKVDGLRFLLSFPIFAISVLFGPDINRIKNRLRHQR